MARPAPCPREAASLAARHAAANGLTLGMAAGGLVFVLAEAVAHRAELVAWAGGLLS